MVTTLELPSLRGIYRGWWAVLISVIGNSMGSAPFAFASFGLFILPLTEEFGWSRAEVSLALTILFLGTGLSQPIVGRLVDRFGARTVLLPSLLALAAGLAGVPLLISSLWHLYAVFLVLGTLGAGTTSVPYLTVLATWFDRRRGIAMGLAVAGVGLGYAYVPLLVELMKNAFGWRAGYYSLAALAAFVTFPLVFLGLREAPASGPGTAAAGTGADPAPQSGRAYGMGFAEMLRQREFWVLAVIFFLLAIVQHGLLAHLVPLLQDQGASSTMAALAASSVGVSVFLSRIATGYLVDRFFAPRVAMVAFSLSLCGITLFTLGVTGLLAFLAAIMLGLSLGAEIDLLAYLISRYFGLRAFGTAYGTLMAIGLGGTALGPLAFGTGFELTGAYTLILAIGIVLNLIVLGLTLLLRAFPTWETLEAASGSRG